MIAATTYDLSLKHALKYLRDKTLALHFILNIQVVAEARLD